MAVKLREVGGRSGVSVTEAAGYSGVSPLTEDSNVKRQQQALIGRGETENRRGRRSGGEEEEEMKAS